MRDAATHCDGEVFSEDMTTPTASDWAWWFAQHGDELARLAALDAAAGHVPPWQQPEGARSTACGWAAYLAAHPVEAAALAAQHKPEPAPDLPRESVDTATGRKVWSW